MSMYFLRDYILDGNLLGLLLVSFWEFWVVIGNSLT